MNPDTVSPLARDDANQPPAQQPGLSTPTSPAPAPTQPSEPTFSPPPFHNPLASDAALTQTPAAPPAALPEPDVAPESPASFVEEPSREPESFDYQAHQAALEADLQQHELTPQPTPIAPAPVRLAPTPSSQQHAAGLASQASQQPFGQSVQAHTPPYAPPTHPKRKRPLVWLSLAAAALVIVGLGGVTVWALRARTKTPTASPTPSSVLQRTRTETPLLSGLERVQTDCYSLQLPAGPTIQVNKDCGLSLTYGEQKLASITVSALRDFNLVNTDDGGSQSATGKRFDSKKVLEALITSTTAGGSIANRQDIKVAGLDAVQITSSAQGANSPVVAYVFIVLPDTDQQFGERSFIAFTVTGAYNDDYSRKGFDQALQTWTWK